MHYLLSLAILLALAPAAYGQHADPADSMSAEGSASGLPMTGAPKVTTLAYLTEFPAEFAGGLVVLESVTVECNRKTAAEISGYDMPGDTFQVTLYERDTRTSGGPYGSKINFFAATKPLGKAMIEHKAQRGEARVKMSIPAEAKRPGGADPYYQGYIVSVEWLDTKGKVVASLP